MGYKKNQRQVSFKYELDRLGHQKMEQVYDILFSKVLVDSKKKKEKLKLVHRGKNSEDSSDLYASVFGPAERRSDNR